MDVRFSYPKETSADHPIATSNASAGSVLAITHRSTSGSNSSNNEQVIVAGAFTTAGSLGCVGICSWNPEDNRWSTLGSGLRSGVVTTMQSGGQVSMIPPVRNFISPCSAEWRDARGRRIIRSFGRNVRRRRLLLILKHILDCAGVCQ
jgi:hypothetical protein